MWTTESSWRLPGLLKILLENLYIFIYRRRWTVWPLLTLIPLHLSDSLVIRLSLSWENQAGHKQVMVRKLESEKVWRMNGTQDSKTEGSKLSVTIKILQEARNQPEGSRFPVKLKGVRKPLIGKTDLCSLCMAFCWAFWDSCFFIRVERMRFIS